MENCETKQWKIVEAILIFVRSCSCFCSMTMLLLPAFVILKQEAQEKKFGLTNKKIKQIQTKSSIIKVEPNHSESNEKTDSEKSDRHTYFISTLSAWAIFSTLYTNVLLDTANNNSTKNQNAASVPPQDIRLKRSESKLVDKWLQSSTSETSNEAQSSTSSKNTPASENKSASTLGYLCYLYRFIRFILLLEFDIPYLSAFQPPQITTSPPVWLSKSLARKLVSIEAERMLNLHFAKLIHKSTNLTWPSKVPKPFNPKTLIQF